MKKIILFILKLLGIKVEQQEETDTDNNQKNETEYIKKTLMTDTEYNFYLKLKELETDYKIVPQLSLSSVIKKLNNNTYYTDLFRIIDFAIFSNDYKELLLLIELNDSTHNTQKRKIRDSKVETICNSCNIKLMKFYTTYPNEKEYVINRILKEIKKDNNTNTDNSIDIL